LPPSPRMRAFVGHVLPLHKGTASAVVRKRGSTYESRSRVRHRGLASDVVHRIKRRGGAVAFAGVHGRCRASTRNQGPATRNQLSATRVHVSATRTQVAAPLHRLAAIWSPQSNTPPALNTRALGTQPSSLTALIPEPSSPSRH